MTTGANFKVTNGRMLWYDPLISGDDLLIQDHEHRMHVKQGTYLPFPQYGNPFVDTLTQEISDAERDMRLVSETKQCTLQDSRFIDSIVNTDLIEIREGSLYFEYEVFKKAGGTISFPIVVPEEPPDPGEPPEILFYNRITEDYFNRINEDGNNRITEFV
ncbi:hypothetical protein KAR91_17735 [Candidatus Pacearchaeota archaeon]|nr:hypothetical protein [Candidatus Pacearchaeota archaeon]